VLITAAEGSDRTPPSKARVLAGRGPSAAPIYRVLDAENPDVTTNEPVFLAQGTADTTVFPQFTTSLSHELKALGDQVRYQQFHGVDHGGIVAAAEPDVLPWLEQRLPPGS
jgi:predicted esterase